MFFFFVPSFVFSRMDQVHFPFFPMVRDKSASYFLKFAEIGEVDGQNGFVIIVESIANNRETEKFGPEEYNK
jgi:hypothetical protein